MNPTIFSQTRQVQRSYINGVAVKDVDITETQDNEQYSLQGHIDGKKISIVREIGYHPIRYGLKDGIRNDGIRNDGMTTKKSRRRRRKSAKDPRSEKVVRHRRRRNQTPKNANKITPI